MFVGVTMALTRLQDKAPANLITGGILTEGGDFLVTEDGDNLVIE